MPEPLLPVAVVAKTRSDEDALAKNLAGSSPATPPCGWSATPRPTRLVLWCMGEAHADVVLDRLRAGGVELDTEPVRVAAAGDVRRGRQGPRPAREAVRRARPVRRLRHRGRAAAARRPASSSSTRWSAARCRTTTSRRWRRASGPRWSAGSSRRSPGRRPPGHAVRRQGAQRRLLRRRVPDRRLAGAARGGRRWGSRAARAGRRGDDPGAGRARRRGDERPVRPAGAGARHRADRRRGAPWSAEVPATELVRYAVELRAMTSGTATFTRSFARYEAVPDHVRASSG